MANNNFKRMTKMQTSEPTADEAGSGMKKGGKAKKMDYLLQALQADVL